ncbi:MAG: hypothetical protein SVO01_00315 [Thermotogota bacterium]|nr:hypothetical protein [Thermotogota bacterium]
MDEKDYSKDSPEMQLSWLLVSLIKENDPKYEAPNKAKMQKWCHEFEKLRKTRTNTEIEVIIRRAQKDSFWKSNILSPKKLREKFTSLHIQYEESLKKGEPPIRPILFKPPIAEEKKPEKLKNEDNFLSEDTNPEEYLIVKKQLRELVSKIGRRI